MKEAKRIKKGLLGFKSLQVGILLFVVIMLFFFSDSNIMKRIDSDKEIRSLKKQIEFYRKKTEADKAKLHELQSDKENLEKFARENYLMKKENEEVFVIE
ncbi:MAG: septum formation initiator family protein [Dysgonamonadaceae bacterium]|jgi:cell division protein FtsB|nr:septum formation initiator family protein [Dysgonamonadaceae bacterium]MDD3355688.1 septum formation initiator family protein [Dysgonamonadaceae bacterium]MDD3727081.1 septum formation initiator family protein [Dysgonamonadaceae bacterium]MDD4246508.1 septum formation initiator family protein [Dysgonamonadaceae bacterium]MDD4604901.1 septum formation initiator family protein [Dysgonamonadaceae bacterium]